MKSKNKQIAKTILQALALGGVVTSVMVFPGLVYMYDWIDKIIEGSRLSKQSSLSRMKKRGMVRILKSEKGVRLILTDKGRRQILRYKMRDLAIEKPAYWDKRWRLAMFDVPEHSRTKRDVIRKCLKSLGFVVVQKSVYIHPYPCSEAIGFLREYHKLSPGQLYLFEARVLEGESILKKHFKL